MIDIADYIGKIVGGDQNGHYGYRLSRVGSDKVRWTATQNGSDGEAWDYSLGKTVRLLSDPNFGKKVYDPGSKSSVYCFSCEKPREEENDYICSACRSKL